MRRILVCAVVLLATGLLWAQAPVIADMRTPYPALHSGVRIAGVPYDPNTVPYGSRGTPVTITGTNLGTSGTVTFGAATATATSWTATRIQVTVPNSANTNLVTVTTSGGTSNAWPFIVTHPNGTYQTASCGSALPGPIISSMVPASGPAGTLVTLLGTSFGDNQGANSVTLAGTTVSAAQWTDTVIMFHVPAGAQSGSVVVTTDVGSSSPRTFTVSGSTTDQPCN